MNSNLVWINVCEASADNYGAMLMRELRTRRPDLRFMGMGGPAMRSQNLETVFKAEDLSLVGLTEVFTAVPRIIGYLRRIKQLMRRERPGILILVDAPDFNFRLARMARRLNIPVLYYIAPQVWAWRQSRVKFLKKNVDRVACIFPFEQDFFQQFGINAEFTGHPVMEILDMPKLENISADNFQVAVLPGSRKREISSLLPIFVEAAELLRRHYPGLTFSIVRAPGISRDYLGLFCPDKPWIRFISPDDRHACIKKSRLAIAASGTVTLECAILEIPTVVAYKVSWLSYLAGRMLIHVKHISMPNIILGREVFPEMIQGRASADNILEAVQTFLDNPQKEAQVRKDLAKIKSILGKRRATKACADLTEELLTRGNRNENA